MIFLQNKKMLPKKKKRFSKFLKEEIFMKEGKKKGEEKISSKKNQKISAHQMTKHKEKEANGKAQRKWKNWRLVWLVATKYLSNLDTKSKKKSSCRKLKPESKIHVPKIEWILSIIQHLALLDITAWQHSRNHGADAPFAGTTFRHSLCHICRGAGPSGQPSALDRLASPRPRLAIVFRPRLHGVHLALNHIKLLHPV